jgi:hypothetical protein
MNRNGRSQSNLRKNGINQQQINMNLSQ